jgi:hypothetical protein
MSNQGQGRGKPGDEFILVRMPSIGVRKTDLVFRTPAAGSRLIEWAW